MSEKSILQMELTFFILVYLEKYSKLMKKYLILSIYLFTLLCFSQPNTEVFLFDLNQKNGDFQLSNFKNISNNEGYDNQPSFLDDNTILYAGTRNGQTDIVKYRISSREKHWICETPGSEYSPLKIPNQDWVSAIRLDKDGKQTLRKYSLKNQESASLIEDIVIGYHFWILEDILASSVLEEDYLSLYISNLSENQNYRREKKVGRSLHIIPNTRLVSFISKAKDDAWEIKSIDSSTGETQFIINTLPGIEDMCWLADGTVVMGKDSILYGFNTKKDKDWRPLVSLTEYGIKNITRLAVSPNGSKLAIVGELTSTALKPKLENIAWIAGNWKGEAFGGQTEENWSEPSGGSMMATFKLIVNEKVSFYEIEIIREVENTLVLQLKHFTNNLKGWEEKDDTVDFPLKEITPNKVIFEGMVFEKVSSNEMNVYVDLHQKDGSVETVKFTYKK